MILKIAWKGSPAKAIIKRVIIKRLIMNKGIMGKYMMPA
jgi:hypothetical protein